MGRAWKAIYLGAVKSLYVELTGEPLRERRIRSQLHWLHRMRNIEAADHALPLLLWAAKNDCPRLLVRILRIHRNLVNAVAPAFDKDRTCSTALHVAARARTMRCVDLLLRKVADAAPVRPLYYQHSFL